MYKYDDRGRLATFNKARAKTAKIIYVAGINFMIHDLDTHRGILRLFAHDMCNLYVRESLSPSYH